MRAISIPPALVPQAWPLVERWVWEALAEGKADIAPGFVRHHLEGGGMQLWLAWDDKIRRAVGCCVTEVEPSVRGKRCNLVAVAGVDFARWRPLLDSIKAFARQQGCARLEAGGREGWVRMLKAEGWHRVRTVIETEL